MRFYASAALRGPGLASIDPVENRNESMQNNTKDRQWLARTKGEKGERVVGALAGRSPGFLYCSPLFPAFPWPVHAGLPGFMGDIQSSML